MSRLSVLLFVVVLAAPMSLAPTPAAAAEAGPFSQGRLRISGGVGGNFVGDDSYFLLSLGAGYYLVDGLELSLDTGYRFDDPFVATVAPGVRYVLHFVPTVKPYVGGYYKHWFIAEGAADFDAVGARGGIFLVIARRAYVGIGVAYEHVITEACSGDECDRLIPELAFSLSF